MKLSRRALLSGVMASAAGVRPVLAQSYPAKPIKLISPYAPGGATDIIARLVGQFISERLGQPVIVENKPGAGTNIGTEAVLRAPGDGYTLLLASSANAVNATLYSNLKFNFLNESTPVGSIGNLPNVLVVHPSFPAKTLTEFVEHARKNPGKIAMGLPGNGSPQHLSSALFAIMANFEVLVAHYNGGGPVLRDLIGGHIEASFASSVSSASHIKQGAIRALAVTSAKRLPNLPNVPSIGEVIPGYEATNVYGIAAPKGTPADVIQKLNAALNEALKDAAILAKLDTLGVTPTPMSAAAFGDLIASETRKWGDVIRKAGIKPD